MTNSAFWQQGEIQAGRSLARPNALSHDFHQTVLCPPDVLEVRLRLGFIPGDGHGRWQLEVVSPGSGELLALASQPHFSLEELDEVLSGVGYRLGEILRDFLNPDPFP